MGGSSSGLGRVAVQACEVAIPRVGGGACCWESELGGEAARDFVFVVRRGRAGSRLARRQVELLEPIELQLHPSELRRSAGVQTLETPEDLTDSQVWHARVWMVKYFCWDCGGARSQRAGKGERFRARRLPASRGGDSRGLVMLGSCRRGRGSIIGAYGAGRGDAIRRLADGGSSALAAPQQKKMSCGVGSMQP